MSPGEILDITRAALVLLLTLTAPLLAASLVTGVVIGLLQALTQVQEMTLTFIPKMIVIIAVIAVTGPFIGSQVLVFSQQVYSRIETGFGDRR